MVIRTNYRIIEGSIFIRLLENTRFLWNLLLRYGLRNASDHRRTISTYVHSYSPPRLVLSVFESLDTRFSRFAAPLSAQSHRYIRANTLKIIFVNSNFIISAGYYRRALVRNSDAYYFAVSFWDERLIPVMTRSFSQPTSLLQKFHFHGLKFHPEIVVLTSPRLASR